MAGPANGGEPREDVARRAWSGQGILGRIHARLLGQLEGVQLAAVAEPVAETRRQPPSKPEPPSWPTIANWSGASTPRSSPATRTHHAVGNGIAAAWHPSAGRKAARLRPRPRRKSLFGPPAGMGPCCKWATSSDSTRRCWKCCRISQRPRLYRSHSPERLHLPFDRHRRRARLDDSRSGFGPLAGRAPVRSVSAAGWSVLGGHEDMARPESNWRMAAWQISAFRGSAIARTGGCKSGPSGARRKSTCAQGICRLPELAEPAVAQFASRQPATDRASRNCCRCGSGRPRKPTRYWRSSVISSSPFAPAGRPASLARTGCGRSRRPSRFSPSWPNIAGWKRRATPSPIERRPSRRRRQAPTFSAVRIGTVARPKGPSIARKPGRGTARKSLFSNQIVDMAAVRNMMSACIVFPRLTRGSGFGGGR